MTRGVLLQSPDDVSSCRPGPSRELNHFVGMSSLLPCPVRVLAILFHHSQGTPKRRWSQRCVHADSTATHRAGLLVRPSTTSSSLMLGLVQSAKGQPGHVRVLRQLWPLGSSMASQSPLWKRKYSLIVFCFRFCGSSSSSDGQAEEGIPTQIISDLS